MKQSIIYICLLILIGGYSACSEKSKSTTSGPSTVSEDSTNIRIAMQLFDYFNDHNWESYAALYIDSARFLDPSFGKNEIVQTRQQTIKKYSGLQKFIPDIKDSVISIYAGSHNTVVVEFVSKGILPDKSRLYLPICTILKIKERKIIEDHTYFDN